ncbi:fungal-specific transcription factor domain-containing protein [Aspergillus granulosus]|uniref:Fungal-specific transcription factor domain-containing protein n=1 Tax=Aspergillus granulosus TaxID=176169 RepID=A0ABR4HZ38_9EURO
MVERRLGKARTRQTTACAECQRRKQKCSREWPCNHCQARKIAHLCKFAPKRVGRAIGPAACETRSSESCQPSDSYPKDEPVSPIKHGLSNYDDLRLLGYLPEFQNVPNGNDGNVRDPQPARTSEMETALRIIPAKPYTDIVIQHFLDNTNYQYYALYPPAFIHEYSTWCSSKTKGLPLTVEFTCLLLRVCACSVPYLDEGIRQKLELELGDSTDHLSVLYHNTAKQLSNTIGPGKGGITQIQQLFLTAQWFKTEALFVESWHALGVAIHEAQEQGMHRSSSNSKLSEFDREMRRRLWCILYAWDWQMSLLLSRPFIINTSCCDFEMPNLQLETVNSEPEAPSPMTHMVLQCQIGLAISKVPGVMRGALSPTQAISIQEETEKWFGTFPSAYSIPNPDTRWDNTHQFVKLQRLQLRVIGYMMMLMPLKQCLTKHFSPGSSSIEKGLQETAIENALTLLAACDDLLRHVLPLNTKFHFAPFLMFDTAALLCSAVVHDKDGSLPQRENIHEAILKTLHQLGRLPERAKTGMICYRGLKRLVACLSLDSPETIFTESKTPQSSVEVSPALPDLSGNADPLIYFPTTNLSPNLFENQVFTDAPLNSNSFDHLGDFTDLSNTALGELGQIWDWGNLNIDFPTGSSVY